MRTIVAVFAVVIALPLLAQTSLIDQGRAAMSRNDADAAATLFEKAVAQNPKSAEAHYLLGTVLEKQGDKKTAAQEYQAALTLASGFAPARQALQRVSR